MALDGDNTVIAAYGDDRKDSSIGSVYVFVRYGTSWTRQQELIALRRLKEGEKKVIISFKTKDYGIYQYQLQLRIMKIGV